MVGDIVSKIGMSKGYMRIRVKFNSSNPRVDGFWVPSRGKSIIWASVKYEKLTNFCYGYGKLGHSHKHCDEFFTSSREEKGKARFGDHLKA
ncbi:hypothetical protein REPUB_Repub05bG0045000 [Reevesia pubescens]